MARADRGFFPSTYSIRLEEIARLASGKLSDGADPGREFLDVAPLEHAGPHAFYPIPAADQGVHSAALIDGSAKIGEGTSIGPYAIIGADVEIGRNCRIAVHVVVERGMRIGDGTSVGAGATLSHCLIGRDCQLHAGMRIGNRGLGFLLDPQDFVDMPQLGRVIVEDPVDVGANSTIDCGAGPDTVIGAGSKIDNLAQIGHNVQMGRGCAARVFR